MSTKTNPGNFFEDFKLGQRIEHATPRTLTHGDVALYTALYGSRFALQSGDAFAKQLNFHQSPLDDLLVFHTVFGKTVPDISLNAVANLGYAEGRFLKPVYPGATLTSVSEVIGLKENSNKQTGVVYVRTEGFDEHDEKVLTYVRWVMVRKRDANAAVADAHMPTLEESVSPDALLVNHHIDYRTFFDAAQSGSPHVWEDYEPGEQIDHVDGMTVEESEHALATRLYQNTARVHFNQYTEGKGRFGKRLIYGGHVISLARALSFNGLANALSIAAINAGRHVNPLFAGETVFAWSQVLDKADIGRKDCGALRLRLVATKDLPCTEFPDKSADGQYPANVILDFDYWALMPRRA